jgi:hypothetical protein
VSDDPGSAFPSGGQDPFSSRPPPFRGLNPPDPFGTGTGGYPGQPPPAPRKSLVRVHASWLAAVLIVAVLAGGGGYLVGRHGPGHASSASPALNPPASGTTPGETPAEAEPCAASLTAASPDAKLLRSLLPMPAGARRVVGRPKSYALKPYVHALYASSDYGAEEALLAGRCFEAAVNSEWRTSTGMLVSIWLIQFAGSSGAQSYALGQASTDVTDLRGHGRHAQVAGVTDGSIIQSPQLDKYGNTLTRLFGTAGPVTILIHEFEAAYLPTEASAETVLLAQAKRLAAG